MQSTGHHLPQNCIDLILSATPYTSTPKPINIVLLGYFNIMMHDFLEDCDLSNLMQRININDTTKNELKEKYATAKGINKIIKNYRQRRQKYKHWEAKWQIALQKNEDELNWEKI